MATMRTFHQRVSRAIKRGKVFDKDIPGYAQDAVKTLEDLWNWKHMWVLEKVVLVEGVGIRNIPRLKTVRFIKRVLDGERLVDLTKISPIQMTTAESPGIPGSYFMGNQTDVFFNHEASEDITLWYGYWRYSEYDDDLAFFEREEGFLIAQTILEMSPLIKDDKVAQRFSSIVAAKVEIITDAEIDAEYDGQDQRMIPFADEMDEFGATGFDES